MCFMCGEGKIEDMVAPECYYYKGVYIFINDIPIMKCNKCKEEFLHAENLEKLGNKLQEVKDTIDNTINKRREDMTSISDGTLRNQDLVPSFIGTLKDLGVDVSELEREIPDNAWEDEYDDFWESAECEFILEDLFTLLSDNAPEGHYFGNAEGDGALFGFWKIEEDDDE